MGCLGDGSNQVKEYDNKNKETIEVSKENERDKMILKNNKPNKEEEDQDKKEEIKNNIISKKSEDKPLEREKNFKETNEVKKIKKIVVQQEPKQNNNKETEIIGNNTQIKIEKKEQTILTDQRTENKAKAENKKISENKDIENKEQKIEENKNINENAEEKKEPKGKANEEKALKKEDNVEDEKEQIMTNIVRIRESVFAENIFDDKDNEENKENLSQHLSQKSNEEEIDAIILGDDKKEGDLKADLPNQIPNPENDKNDKKN